MEQTRKSIYSIGSLLLLALLFVVLTILSGLLFKGVRLDLTENHLYTLSQGTKNILGNLEEPVNMYLFFSEEASKDLPQIRSYAQRVTEMLEEFADHSDGKLRLQRINPQSFSEEEDQAAGFGLQAVPVGASGESLYFGIAASNSLDDVQVMPFIQPDKEEFLEYDLAKMVSTLSYPQRKKVAIISSLPIGPGFDPGSQSVREPWTVYTQLSQLFEVEMLDPAVSNLPEDLDLLVLVHPKALAPDLTYQIDQFVLAGGRLVAFMDPFAESDIGGNPNDPMARLNAGSSSTLGSLLTAWGVQYSATQVIADIRYALQVGMGAGQAPVRHPVIVGVTREGMNKDDIVSADLEMVNFSSAGWLQPVEDASTEFSALVTSSDQATSIDAQRLRFLSDPSELLENFEATGDLYAFAARITGPAQTAFDTLPEGVDEQQRLLESGPQGVNVVLFADTDFLADQFWVQKQQFFGQTLASAFADNGSFVVNAVDNMLGNADLIAIRTRATSSRPFDRVERLRVEAESRYRSTEENLQLQLQETERKLSEMQTSREDGDIAVLNEAQQAEIQRFLDRKLEIRRDLRAVQHDLDREIQNLGTRLKVINIILIPLLVSILAVVFWARRRSLQSARGEHR